MRGRGTVKVKEGGGGVQKHSISRPLCPAWHTVLHIH